MSKEKQTAMTPPPATQALEVYDYGGDEGAGFENQTAADRKLPMLMLVQSNSPQVKNRQALPGQWWNTLTQTAHDAIEIVPAITDHCAIEWLPRDDGGGFRGRHLMDSKVVRDAVARNGGKMVGKLAVPQPADPKTNKPSPDHELVEAFEVWSVICAGKEPVGMAVISFSSTKIKAYREWNTQLSMFQVQAPDGRKRTVPLFAHHVRLGAKETSNKFGTFFVPTLVPANGDLRSSLLSPQDPRYLAAKMLREQYHQGVVRAGYEAMTRDDDSAAPNPEGESAF